jgi:hypothetical protein
MFDIQLRSGPHFRFVIRQEFSIHAFNTYCVDSGGFLRIFSVAGEVLNTKRFQKVCDML